MLRGGLERVQGRTKYRDGTGDMVRYRGAKGTVRAGHGKEHGMVRYEGA